MTPDIYMGNITHYILGIRETERVIDNVHSAFVLSIFNGMFVITKDGVLWASGDNTSGKVGDGTTEPRRELVRIMDNMMLPATLQ